jgi:3-O-methylgallate 3,4-dioxygenase
MADLVLAVGTSHSPALGSSAEDYVHHAERDMRNPNLLDKEGRPISYDELLAGADPAMADQITPEAIAGRVAGCRNNIERLAETIAEARLDALIIVGDDQHEQYHDENQPAMLVYWGDSIRNEMVQLPDDAPDHWRRARAQFHEQAGPRDYPVESGLALHLAEHLIENQFDISHGRFLQHDRGEGHAFGFVHRRLMSDAIVPVVPVILNTYYPPNQPRPDRCFALGRAIRAAVEDWEPGRRIGILASGGLSHFTIDEELDRGVLDGCRNGDGDALGAIPVAKLNSGNSEIRNWIAVAGAAEGLATDWQDYLPCYRTPAGTGCAMAFAVWR